MKKRVTYDEAVSAMRDILASAGGNVSHERMLEELPPDMYPYIIMAANARDIIRHVIYRPEQGHARPVLTYDLPENSGGNE